MDVSVIICTYNRSVSLISTLQSLEELDIPPDMEWELLLVNNNSTDDTKDVIDDYLGHATLHSRYLFEESQGLSHARNLGVREARGDIILFTDDDVIVDRFWLRNMVEEFRETGAACIGGKIVPLWEGEKPSWLDETFYGHLALLDLGDRRVKLDMPTLWGANLAIKKDLFNRYGYFDATVGRTGGKLYSGEETLFIQNLLTKGEPVYYSPKAVVQHLIPRKRMEKSYFRKWFFDDGELSAIQLGEYNQRNLFGVPLYTIKEFFQALAHYLFMQLFKPGECYRQQVTVMHYLGFISGRIRHG